jgi:hypothetical protein
MRVAPRKGQASSVCASSEVRGSQGVLVKNALMVSQRQDERAQRGHRRAAAPPHKRIAPQLLPLLHLAQQRVVARNEQDQHQRRSEDDVAHQQLVWCCML